MGFVPEAGCFGTFTGFIVKELQSGDYYTEAPLSTIYPYDDNLN